MPPPDPEVPARVEQICQGGGPQLKGLPVLPDAAAPTCRAGFLRYTTARSADQVMDFYRRALGAEQWELVAPPPEAHPGFHFFRTKDRTRFVLISTHAPEDSPGTCVTIRAQEGVAEAGVAVPNLLVAITSLLSETRGPPSFHVESTGRSPRWNSRSGKVEMEESALKADVQGKDLHIFRPRGDTSLDYEEYFVVGEKEYALSQGQLLLQAMPQASLSWPFWKVFVMQILTAAGQRVTAPREEPIDGRPAQAVTIEGSGQGLAWLGFGPQLTQARGTAWVDKETGVLVKATVDYEVDLRDQVVNAGGKPPRKPVTGSGQLTLEITRIGRAKVALPTP